MSHPTSTLVAIKNLGYIPAFLLGLSMENYTILFIFMIVDLITGLIRAYTIDGGKAVRSYDVQMGVLKKTCVLMVPMLIVWTGRGIDVDMLKLAHGFLGMLILAEAYSIIRNILVVSRKEDTTEFDAVSYVLERIGLVLQTMFKKK